MMTLRDRWKVFERTLEPMGRDEREHTRRIFFAGATCALDLVRESVMARQDVRTVIATEIGPVLTEGTRQ